MKRAFKLIRNNNNKVIDTKISASVSFMMVAQNVLGARESSRVMKIADETKTTIKITSGKKSGNSKSIISLMNLGILPGKSLVLSIEGENTQEAFHKFKELMSGSSANQ